jgi:hypothetical protein
MSLAGESRVRVSAEEPATRNALNPPDFASIIDIGEAGIFSTISVPTVSSHPVLSPNPTTPSPLDTQVIHKASDAVNEATGSVMASVTEGQQGSSDPSFSTTSAGLAPSPIVSTPNSSASTSALAVGATSTSGPA